MTMPDERYRAVIQTAEFLKELINTPRVPRLMKDKARGCLRHYPNTWEMDQAAEGAPAYFQKQMEPLYRMVKQYELTKEENESK